MIFFLLVHGSSQAFQFIHKSSCKAKRFCSKALLLPEASATFRRKLHLSKMSPCPDPYLVAQNVNLLASLLGINLNILR